MKRNVAIGIDIGGTNTVFGFLDKDGNCLVKNSISTQTHKDVKDFLKDLYVAIEETKTTLGEDVEIKGIGIGAPNGNYYSGTIEFAPNLRWEGVIPIVELFKSYYEDIPIVLTNDANAAAVGEMIYGGAKGMKDFLVITLGTGLGSGLVVNGSIVYGVDGFAGEIGHAIVEKGGRDCGCGRKGCLETYVSATGIKRTAFDLLCNRIDKSELRNVSFNDLTAKMIAEAAQRGDKLALEAFEITGKYLGEALADTIAYLSPEAIFLFGGLANAGDLIMNPTEKYLKENVLKVFKSTKLLMSSLEDNNAAIVGSSALVWLELIKKGIEV
jgi:glucokinase